MICKQADLWNWTCKKNNCAGGFHGGDEMIVATQLVFSLIVALIISWILSLFLNKESGPRSGFFFLFLIIFLITYAGGLWIRPLGPSLLGVFWLPVLFISILAGLFAYRSAPSHRKQHSREETLQMLEENEKRKQLEQVTYVTLDILFWLIISLLLLSILYRLFWGE
jgi:hypothetical protein